MEVKPLRQPLRLLLCNLKGGPGKTTSTWFLALAFARMGYRVATVDADLGSKTLTSWHDRCVRGGDTVPFHVKEWRGEDEDGNLSKFCRDLEAEHKPDIVIVDTGGERREVFMSACLWADRLLMPVGPSLAEIERLRATRDHAAEVAHVSPIAVSALLTRVPAAGVGLAAKSRQIIECEEPNDDNDKKPYGLHVMATEIALNRHTYSTAFGYVTAALGEYADLALELLDEQKGEQ